MCREKGLYTFHLLWAWLLCLMLPNIIDAQQYNYRHYTTREGLPSSSAYSITQDDKGFLWIATSQGLARFDGYKFKVYTVQDGLPSNDVLAVIKGKKGKLWLVCYSNVLSYYDTNTDKVEIFDKYQLASMPLNVQEGDDGKVYVGTTDKGLLVVNRDSVMLMDTTDLPLINNYVFPYLDSYGELWVSGRMRFFKYKNFTPFFEVPDSIVHWDFIKIHQMDNGRVILYSGHHLLEIKDGKLTVVFTTQGNGSSITINSVESDKANNLLVSTQNGAYLLPEDINDPIKSFLPEIPVSRFFEDSEGSYWLTTLNEGVFMLPSSIRMVENITMQTGLKNNNISSLFTIGGKLYYASKNGVVGKWDNSHLLPEIARRYIFSSMGNCYLVSDSIAYCTSNYGSFLLNYKAKKPFDEGMVSYNGYDSLISKNEFSLPLVESFSSVGAIKSSATNGMGKIWVGGINGLMRIVIDTTARIVNHKRLYAERVTAICYRKDGSLWFTSLDSLGVMDVNGRITTTHLDSFGINGYVTKIFEDPNQNVWFASSGYGMYVYGDDKLYNLSAYQGLTSNFVTSATIHKQHLILGTTSGLALGKFTQSAPYIENLHALDINEAFMSNEVNDIKVFNEKLYVATNKGISVTSIESFTNDTVTPKVYITRCQINERDTTVQGSYVLSSELNSLKFEYVGLLYKADGRVLYRYKMDGIDTAWVTTMFTNVQYPALKPGSYNLSIDARSPSGPWTDKPVTVTITILPPLWQTWWFRVLTGLLAIAIVTAISYSVIRYYRKQSFIAQRMVELEGNALRANMNPHFVFNALNAIHDFIANSDEKSAHLYLGKFAKLTRRILDQSRKNFVSLEEELDTILLYLELENMRFEHKFHFEINIEDGIQPYDVELPPMLIQPYLENAVRHGLMNLDKAGKITVDFRLQKQYLECTITDNGVGRAKAMEMSSKRLKSHRSVGMDITQKRVELLREATKYDKGSGVTIVDLVDGDGLPLGTKVSILLPLKEV